MDRRSFLHSLLGSLALVAGAGVSAPAQGRGERLPAPVARAVARNPRYAGAEVTGINVRRGAPTQSGTMYEVRMRGRDGRMFLVYVDPDTGRVLYDTR